MTNRKYAIFNRPEVNPVSSVTLEISTVAAVKLYEVLFAIDDDDLYEILASLRGEDGDGVINLQDTAGTWNLFANEDIGDGDEIGVDTLAMRRKDAELED